MDENALKALIGLLSGSQPAPAPAQPRPALSGDVSVGSWRPSAPPTNLMGGFMSGMDPNAPTEQPWSVGTSPNLPNMQPVMDARQGMMNWFQSAPQQTPMPGNVAPAFRTEDAIKGGLGLLLASLLGGNQGANAFGENYVKSKLGKAEMDTQQNQQKWQMGNQQAQQDYQRQGQMAQFGLRNAEQDYEQQLQEQEKILKAKELDVRNQQVDAEKARMGYQNANTEGEKLFWGKRLQALDKANAPTDEMIQTDVQAMKGQRYSNALIRWNEIKKSWTNDYGELNPSQKAEATKQRDAIAAGFGVSPDQLPLPLDGATLKKQMQEEKIADMVAKGARADDKAIADIAKIYSEIEYKQRKFDADQEKARMNNDIRMFDANTRRMNAEMGALKGQADTKVQSKINEFSSKIQGLKAKQKSEQSISKRRSMQAQIDSFQAQREFYEGLRDKTPGTTSKPSVGTSEFTTPGGNRYSFGG